MSVVTDSYTMNITIIEHGIAHIVQPVTFPTSVEANTPFDITYTVRNDGPVEDILFGHLLVGEMLPGSSWTETVAPEGLVTKTYTHPGIAENTSIILEVGHN